MAFCFQGTAYFSGNYVKDVHSTLHPETLHDYKYQAGMRIMTIFGMDILALHVYCYLLHYSQETSLLDLTGHPTPHDQNQGISQF